MPDNGSIDEEPYFLIDEQGDNTLDEDYYALGILRVSKDISEEALDVL